MKIIGTEHILYALINQPTSKAVVMFQKLAINVTISWPAALKSLSKNKLKIQNWR